MIGELTKSTHQSNFNYNLFSDNLTNTFKPVYTITLRNSIH